MTSWYILAAHTDTGYFSENVTENRKNKTKIMALANE
jgi:hypothetical protein